jgi:hypothetical protein
MAYNTPLPLRNCFRAPSREGIQYIKSFNSRLPIVIKIIEHSADTVLSLVDVVDVVDAYTRLQIYNPTQKLCLWNMLRAFPLQTSIFAATLPHYAIQTFRPFPVYGHAERLCCG